MALLPFPTVLPAKRLRLHLTVSVALSLGGIRFLVTVGSLLEVVSSPTRSEFSRESWGYMQISAGLTSRVGKNESRGESSSWFESVISF